MTVLVHVFGDERPVVMYTGEVDRHGPGSGKMPMVHWVFLGVSSAAMVLGVINLFGVDGIAAVAAAFVAFAFTPVNTRRRR